MATTELGATAARSLNAEELAEVLCTVKDGIGMCEETSSLRGSWWETGRRPMNGC